MKVILLAVATLCLTAVARANLDYHIKCSRDEIGIRWPSYHSNSDYYVCQREGAKQLKVSCDPGLVFTFVLQACTSPNKFIPPPPMDILPTVSPLNARPVQGGGDFHGDYYGQATAFPKPQHPVHAAGPISYPGEPPILSGPPNWEIPNVKPPVFVDNEAPETDLTESEEDNSVPDPAVPGKPGKPQPPLPPTPAPTPPLVQVTPPAKKQPPVPTGTKKQPPAPAGKKPPVPGKKQPPMPPGGSKRQMPKLPSKLPAKAPAKASPLKLPAKV